MQVELPAALQAIAEEAERFSKSPRATFGLEADWQAYLEQARARVPELTIDAAQATVCLGELSPGCRACKEGTWDCIFVTQKCNLDCAFCYNPQHIPLNHAGSAFGSTPEEIAGNYCHTRITGISFSGGEPFLERQRLLDWAAYFREHFPQSYLWVYTNGLRVEQDALQQLGRLKVDEIRFNTAASGYDHPTVLEVMRQAGKHIGRITVEIPAVPEHAEKVQRSLAIWAAAGVRYLNLHELMFEPGTNSWKMNLPRQEVRLADGHHTAVHPHSRAMMLKVIEQVQQQGLPLSVNQCSLQNKVRQVHGRRLNLLPLTQEPYEKLLPGDVLESYCLYHGSDPLLRCHPDQLDEMRQRYPQHGWVRLGRLAPLGVQDRGQWVMCEVEGRHG